MSMHSHTGIIALLSVTRSSLWERSNLVTSYCHKDLSVKYTKREEPVLAGILWHLKESHDFSPFNRLIPTAILGDLSQPTHSAGPSGCSHSQ